ncbi:MAG: glycosyltransferase family 4 protein [Clostridia bacterium]|nr:glycosyltransferase family 4 protein [Clostridia bacterium]
MKILLLSPLPPPEGGIATWTTLYLEYCNKNNIQVSVVNTATNGKRALKINSKRNLFDELKRTFKIIKDLKHNLKKDKVDVVHINTSCSKFGIIRDYLCAKIIKKQKIPFVLQTHCNVGDQIKSKLQLKYFIKFVGMANKILTLNKTSFEYVSKYAKDKAQIVPNFIKETDIEKIVKVNKELKRVIFVGHVQRTKGIFELIEVAKTYIDINFDVYGPIGGEVKDVKIPSNVKLLGNTEHFKVLKALSNYDLFLFPTYTEGFSYALCEAMDVGLPVIATNVGANEDMIENKGGIIVEPKNVQAIIDAFEVMKDSLFRQSCSNFNKNKVETCYKLERVLENILEIYERVIKGYDL